jgi:hypothetical protein
MPPRLPTIAALACLGVLGALSGCFDIKYDNCRITCSASQGLVCPPGLTCHVLKPGDDDDTGLCAPMEMTCPSQEQDAGTDADTMDAGPDGTDAMDGGSLPPQVLCHAGNCLTLPDAVRSNLVLLLWPSNLPAVGSEVSIWADQSGYGNDAHALYLSALPHVIADGVHLNPDQIGSGFVVGNSPSLDFASSDFAVIVVAGLSSSTEPVSFFRQSDGARSNSRQITIDWVRSSTITGRPQGTVDDTVVASGMDTTQPAVRSYALRRATDHLQLRLNGSVLGNADLPTPGASTTSTADTYVGVANILGTPADSIEAVIAIRGATPLTDLEQLEAFLRTVFATAP